MASIKYDPQGQKGKISYNSDIVSGIVVLSLKETEGIELLQTKNKGIKVSFEREGVYVDVSVIAHYGFNAPDLAYRIQQTIKEMVESMTKYRIAQVDVHVQNVIMPEELAAKAAAEKAEEAPAEAPTENSEEGEN